ncbi:hypothetical protein BRD20_09040 [Halobacteriales archaeon SW_8_65_20]|nr:MAG: hypothetical protein BRD20_09040 [Halobacteriales archaeon SW_8_65_20]
MPDVDIEIIDGHPEAGEYGYPMAVELEVEGIRVRKDDLLLSPETEKIDRTWEPVYGFDWGGIYTDSLTEFQLPRFHKWSDFVEAVKHGNHEVILLQEEVSYYVDEETVETLSYYRRHHQDGFQSVLVRRTRHPLETTLEFQSQEIYEETQDMIEDIYSPEALSSVNEAEAIYEFLTDAGIITDTLPEPEVAAEQSGLESFKD